MKLKYCIALIGLLLKFFSFSQETNRYYFEMKNDYIKRGKYKSFSFKLYTSNSNTVIFGNDNSYILKLATARIYLNRQSDTARGSYIDFAGGATTDGNLFITIDKNYNKKFTDDEIYFVNMDTVYQTRADFINAWPIIRIDSLKVYDSSNVLHIVSINILPCIFPDPGFNYFKNSTQVLSSKLTFELQLYTLNYMHTSFNFNNNVYELNIDLYPLQYPSHQFLRVDKLLLHNVTLYQKIGGKDSVIYLKPFSSLENDIRNGTKFLLGDTSFRVAKISIDSSYIEIKGEPFSKQSHYNNKKTDNLINFSGFDLNSKKKVKISTSRKMYTLLFFTGSWCIPCHEVQPLVKAMYQKNKDDVQLVSILVERSLKEAQLYFSKSKTNWPAFYENNLHHNSNDISRKLSVTIFPTFILLNKKGQIIYRGTSSSAIEDIRNLFVSP